jgi:hypothetical protein
MLKSKTDKAPDGRKYRMGILMMLVLLGGFALAGVNPVLASLYPELITGLGIIYLTYCGGNVGNKWVLGKKGGLTMNSEPPKPEEQEEE